MTCGPLDGEHVGADFGVWSLWPEDDLSVSAVLVVGHAEDLLEAQSGHGSGGEVAGAVHSDQLVLVLPRQVSGSISTTHCYCFHFDVSITRKKTLIK